MSHHSALAQARLREQRAARRLRTIGPWDPNYDLAWERAIAATKRVSALEARRGKFARLRRTKISRSR